MDTRISYQVFSTNKETQGYSFLCYCQSLELAIEKAKEIKNNSQNEDSLFFAEKVTREYFEV